MSGYGAVNAQAGFIHYDQTKCFLDVFLHDLKSSGQTKFWLETCNMHALASAVDAVGADWKLKLPVGADGKPLFTQAGMMFLALYSGWGQSNAPVVKDGMCENEIMQNVAWIAEQLAYIKATIVTAVSGLDLIAKMDASLKRGSANVFSYLTDYKTGHYINQVWRDPDAGMFTSMDSWPGNMHCVRGGDHEVYKDAFFATRCDPDRLRFIEIHKL